MFVLVSYDVKTSDTTGPKRLRRVARVCKDYGQRVQYSVFECIVPPDKWVVMRDRLIKEIDEDSYAISNMARSFFLALTHAKFSRVPLNTPTRRYYQNINRYSAAFALTTDFAMLTLGGNGSRNRLSRTGL